MITFRPVDLEADYPTLCEWWKGHNSLPVPKVILPRGWIAEAGALPIAASFLYAVDGKIGMIEWTTTNPKMCWSRDLVAAVKGLYLHLEAAARAQGCVAMISMVEPEAGEERVMLRMGYATSADAKPHRMLAKPILPFS